jgi:hypothetical protein
MNSKLFIKSFFLLSAFVFVIIEILFQVNKCSYKNRVDYIVNYKLDNINNKLYNSMLLGDSVSTMALSNTTIKNNILNLSTTVPVSFVGNYFMIERYLENNNKVNTIYLFTTMELLNEILDRDLTYSYFESVFTKKSEINEVKKIRPELYSNTILDNYFISRRNSLSLPKCFKTKKKQGPVHINENILIKKENFTNRAIKDRIKKYKKYTKIPKISKLYLNKIIEICSLNNIRLVLIIEPSLEKANEIFIKSQWEQYLDKIPIKIININEYYQFNNYAFESDGLHLRGNNNLYYQNLINKHVIKLYKGNE